MAAQKTQAHDGETETIVPHGTINNYRDFDSKVLEIHRTWSDDPDQYIEVTDDFFRALTKGSKGDMDYITFGSPGIKVYRAGMKPKVDALDRMSAEEYHERHVKKKSAEFQDLLRNGRAREYKP